MADSAAWKNASESEKGDTVSSKIIMCFGPLEARTDLKRTTLMIERFSEAAHWRLFWVNFSGWKILKSPLSISLFLLPCLLHLTLFPSQKQEKNESVHFGRMFTTGLAFSKLHCDRHASTKLKLCFELCGVNQNLHDDEEEDRLLRNEKIDDIRSLSSRNYHGRDPKIQKKYLKKRQCAETFCQTASFGCKEDGKAALPWKSPKKLCNNEPVGISIERQKDESGQRRHWPRLESSVVWWALHGVLVAGIDTHHSVQWGEVLPT